MSRQPTDRMSRPQAALLIAKGSFVSLYQHWAMALFSLAAAFGIWFVIQDVENPRVTATFPEDGTTGIVVQPTNAERFIPTASYAVSVRVEGRQDDIVNLSQDDFEASVDIEGITPDNPQERAVTVTAKRSGVRVLEVRPSTVFVQVEPVVEQQFDVVVNRLGQLPAGFSEADIKIEPPKVTVRGSQAAIERIASVSLGVNLNNQREGTTVVEDELVARSITNARLDVSITPSRAKVTLQIQQDFVQRNLPVVPVLSGQPAAGYRIVGISVEPPSVFASGPAERMATLTQLPTEAIQLTNATAEIRLLRNIEAPQNVSLERRSVTVIIQVKPIECTAVASGSPCGTVLIQVAPTIENQPSGLFITGIARVSVQLTGPLTVLDAILPSQIQAKVSLTGAVAGTGTYSVTVTIPAALASQGVRAEQPTPIQLTLASP